MPPVEMRVHEFTRGLEELCRGLGVEAHVTAVGPGTHPAPSATHLQFEGGKVLAEIKTDGGRVYEISLEIAEK